MFPIFPRAVQKWPREPATWKGIRKDPEITTKAKVHPTKCQCGHLTLKRPRCGLPKIWLYESLLELILKGIS